jgi:hypothetical protein
VLPRLSYSPRCRLVTLTLWRSVATLEVSSFHDCSSARREKQRDLKLKDFWYRSRRIKSFFSSNLNPLRINFAPRVFQFSVSKRSFPKGNHRFFCSDLKIEMIFQHDLGMTLVLGRQGKRFQSINQSIDRCKIWQNFLFS